MDNRLPYKDDEYELHDNEPGINELLTEYQRELEYLKKIPGIQVNELDELITHRLKEKYTKRKNAKRISHSTLSQSTLSQSNPELDTTNYSGKNQQQTLYSPIIKPVSSLDLLKASMEQNSILSEQINMLEKKLADAVYSASGSTNLPLTLFNDDQTDYIIEHLKQVSMKNDSRLKKAAQQERRQATRFFGKVKPGLCWTAPLPVRQRPFSIEIPPISCKVFLGGIPHDLQERDLCARLNEFGPCRVEWPTDGTALHRRSNHGKAGYVYVIYDHEQSVHQLLQACLQQTHRHTDGRCEYYLNVPNPRSASRRKSIQIIPWFTEDSQWCNNKDDTSPFVQNDRNKPSEADHTVFVGALHGMMTAYALAQIFTVLFGRVEFAAIDTDRNKYPIGSGRVIFADMHSYFSAITANYIFIDCDRFSKVIQVDPYLIDTHTCSGTDGKQCSNTGQYFCRSLKCWKYYCANCWSIKHSVDPKKAQELNVYDADRSTPAMIHKPLMRNARSQ